jgi:hypothetical protein
MSPIFQIPAGPCSTCNSHIDDETLSKYILLEDSYVTRLGQTDQTDLDDLFSVQSDALNLFHDYHWVVYVLDTWIGEALKKKDESIVADRQHHIQRRIQFLNHAFPPSNYTTAWAYEELGDCFATMNRSRESETAYAESYWRIKILCGTDHPFAESISTKWVSITNSDDRSQIMERD